MAWCRRVRWIAITVLIAALAGALAIGAEAYADRSTTGCTPPAAAVAGHPGHGSWRSGAFRAAGCRAWRTMHAHHVHR